MTTTFRSGRKALLALLCVSALMSCSLHLNADTLGIRATVAEPAGEQPQGQDFEVTRRAVYLLWGMLPISRPSLEDALAGQLVDGGGVAGVGVHSRSRFWDVFVTVITAGVVVPRSVTFAGTVVPDAN